MRRVAILTALVVSVALTACAHRYDVHCDLVDGTWHCSGNVGGSLPSETPGI